jgi:Arc/MetJ-type ribon-helix-helix transcriptional regulator
VVDRKIGAHTASIEPKKGIAMTIELTPEHQRMIERVMHSGAHPDAQHVISAALEALAEDVDDVAITKAREHEPRVSLDEAEAELRALGKLK